MFKSSYLLVAFFLLSAGAFAEPQPLDSKGDNKEKKRNSVSVGLLNGGALVGAEYEYLFYGPFAATAGAGILGANAGLNVHIGTDIDTGFLHLGVVNNGFGTAVSRYVEFSSNVRAFGWLQASFGLGYNFYFSDAFKETYEDLSGAAPPVFMLTYSAAWYTTF